MSESKRFHYHILMRGQTKPDLYTIDYPLETAIEFRDMIRSLMVQYDILSLGTAIFRVADILSFHCWTID